MHCNMLRKEKDTSRGRLNFHARCLKQRKKILVLHCLSYRKAEGRKDGRECGESDIDDYAPLILVFVCHNLLKVYGLRLIV